MGSIKDRNGMDLTEAEDIKKRWKEYTEELYSSALPELTSMGPRTDEDSAKMNEQRNDWSM